MTVTSRNAPLIRRLLVPLQVLSLVCLMFAAGGVAAASGPWSGSSALVAIVYVAAVPVVAVLWAVRARQRSERARAVLSAIVAAALIPVAVLGAVGFTIPVLLLAVALVVVDIGRRAGYLAALAVGIAGTTLHLTSGNGVMVGLVNSLPVVVMLCFGIGLGSALRAYEDTHERDRRIIAERDEALARLEDALARLRRTTEVEKELILADERARSARDLHDGLGHRLTLISMSLEFARRMREKEPDTAWDEVATADTTSREALAHMRTWVRALSPVRDTDATGVAAFEAIAESFRGTGLDVTVEADDPDLELTEDASLLLYRAVQEGLTNALRHARAGTVRITLTSHGDDVVLHLINDLDPSARERIAPGALTPGFGLRGLVERAGALDGTTRAARHGDEVDLAVRLPAHRALTDHRRVQEDAASA